MRHYAKVTDRRYTPIGGYGACKSHDFVAENIATDTLTIGLDSEWEQMERTVVLFETEGGEAYAVPYEDNVRVPYEVLHDNVTFRVSVCGYVGEEKRLVTARMERPYTVVLNGAMLGDAVSPVTTDALEQAYVNATSAADAAYNAANRAMNARDDAIEAAGDADAASEDARQAAEEARAALDVQSPLSKDGGTISLGTVPIAKGGTGATTATGARAALDVYSTDDINLFFSNTVSVMMVNTAEGGAEVLVALTSAQIDAILDASDKGVPLKLHNPADAGWTVTTDGDQLTESKPLECHVLGVEIGAITVELTLGYRTESFLAHIPVSDYERMELSPDTTVYVHVPSVGWTVLPDKAGELNGITVVL